MAAGVDAHPGISDLTVFTGDGSALASSRQFDAARGNEAERAYFARHQDDPSLGFHISEPIRSGGTGRFIVRASRRFEDAAHRFAGVAVATVDLDAFARFYESFENGKNGYVALLNQDGTLLVRAPPIPGDVGTNLSESQVFRDFQGKGPVGTATRQSRLDGTERLTSFRAVEHYPLVVFVARSTDDVLANWRRDAAIALSVSLCVALALGLFGWRLLRYMRLHRKTGATLRASELHYRLLADHGTDLITQVDAKFRRIYVSPASQTLLGFTPDEMLGMHPTEIAHPEDREAVAAYLAAGARDGFAPAFTYRARRKDGTWIWLEAVGRRTADGGMVAALRDVSGRKAAEAALHDANARLQQIAMQDGLTGIANRRCFDQTLAREHRRAARLEMPLALLLVDVDWFKAFNDTYGHLAGDACLRGIAQALDPNARRPLDLVARYGGEEFAVLLPDTDEAGAMAIAEAVRKSVRELALDHAGSPAGMVSVSIGVGVARPRPAGPDATGLVDMADAALYRAKAAGRDRVCANILGVPELGCFPLRVEPL